MSVPIVNMQPKPSLGQSFGEGMSAGLGKLLGDYRQKKQNQTQLKGLAPLFEDMGIEAEKVQQLVDSGLDPTQAIQAMGHVQKARGQMKEEAQLKQIGQGAFDTMADILSKGKLGRSSKVRGFFFDDTGEDVGQFESSTGALESMLVDMVSRGTLSNARFKYITETLLPKATDTEAAIRGKLKALAPMLGLDASALTRGKGSSDTSSGRTVRMMDPTTKQIYPVPEHQVDTYKQKGAQVIR